MKTTVLEKIKKGLIVSCQALADEPLHSAQIMARMAIAAQAGGAVGIRANGIEDIQAIRAAVTLPIIGIVKAEYPDSEVYITPTKVEVDALAQTGCEIIALDATQRQRPNGETLAELVAYAKHMYPDLLLMADCATVADVSFASEIGFDLIAPTLIGYTHETQGMAMVANEYELFKAMRAATTTYFVAEGNVNTPEIAKTVLQLGADSVVVGSMITRPQLITKRFVDEIQQSEGDNYANHCY